MKSKNIYYKVKSLNLLMDGADEEHIKIIDETKNKLIKSLSIVKELSKEENDLIDSFINEYKGVYDIRLLQDIFTSFRGYIESATSI